MAALQIFCSHGAVSRSEPSPRKGNPCPGTWRGPKVVTTQPTAQPANSEAARKLSSKSRAEEGLGREASFNATDFCLEVCPSPFKQDIFSGALTFFRGTQFFYFTFYVKHQKKSVISVSGSWEDREFQSHSWVHGPLMTNGTIAIIEGDGLRSRWTPWLACLPSARPRHTSCLDSASSTLPSLSPHTPQQAHPGPGLHVQPQLPYSPPAAHFL